MCAEKNAKQEQDRSSEAGEERGKCATTNANRNTTSSLPQRNVGNKLTTTTMDNNSQVPFPNEWPTNDWMGLLTGQDVEQAMEFLADDQMKHAEAPSDEELDEMFATVGSDSEEYHIAH